MSQVSKHTHSSIPIFEKCMEIMKNTPSFQELRNKLEDEADIWSLPTVSEVLDMWRNFYIPFCKKNHIIIPDIENIESELKKTVKYLSQHPDQIDG